MENGVYSVHKQVDLLILGAGPAGMRAAIEASQHDLEVMVVDEQPAPGGQIWRAVEDANKTSLGRLLGSDYLTGANTTKAFRDSPIDYRPLTQVWQIEAEKDGWQIYMSHNQKTHTVFAKKVILATGAQERPVPIPGWTLPGVFTVGAAQIALKTSAEIPSDPVWIAGSGPLVLLYIVQLLNAGGQVAGWIDTSPKVKAAHTLPLLFGALGSRSALLKGHRWVKAIKAAGVPIYKQANHIKALGDQALEAVQFEQADGTIKKHSASVLLVHEGVIPSIHLTKSLGCAHEWSEQQQCFAPVLDEWNQTSLDGLYVAGDGAEILGAEAALAQGQLTALGVTQELGKLTAAQANEKASALKAQLKKERSLRQLLDTLYPPRKALLNPTDDTIVCRCEELSAKDIRAVLSLGTPGPNQVKSLTRAGMGPCQGRQCAYTVAGLIANEQGKSMQEVGLYRVRPPLKPLTLGMLASLDREAEQ